MPRPLDSIIEPLPNESVRQTVERAASARLSLRDADLSYADLRYADLSHADLSGAAFGGAALQGARIDGSIALWCSVGWSDHGHCGRTLTGLYDGERIILSCGCWTGTEEQLREYIAKDAPDLAVSRSLAMDFVIARIKEMLASRGTNRRGASHGRPGS